MSFERRIPACLGEPSPKEKRLASRVLLAGMLLSALTSLPAVAQPFTPYDEIRKKSQIFEPRVSFDSTPVTIRVLNVTYRIPRHYVTIMPPAILTLRVTLPDFQPIDRDNQHCFDPKWRVANPEGCTALEFRVVGTTGPGPGERILTNADKLANHLRGMPTAVGRPGPFGYTIYDRGPKEARIEYYRRAEGDIFFSCHFSAYKNERRIGICSDTIRLDDMNHVQFYFQSPQIGLVPEIERRLRALMASFFIAREGSDGHDHVELGDARRH